jgi:hypothetical protein
MFKRKIDEKLEKIVDHIISKQEDEITLEDYTILRDVRSMESESDTRERMERFASMAASGFGFTN